MHSAQAITMQNVEFTLFFSFRPQINTHKAATQPVKIKADPSNMKVNPGCFATGLKIKNLNFF
jgi:hypothetical protein